MASTFEALILAQNAFLLNPPIAVLTQNVIQTLTTSVWTDLTMDTSTTDTYGGHSTVTNSQRYTSQVAGWYEASGVSAVAINATGGRGVRLAVNGSPVQSSVGFVTGYSANASGVPTPTCLVYLAVGSYVTCQAWQSSGGNLNTFTSSDLASGLNVTYKHQ